MSENTYEKNANKFSLWVEYVDPNGEMTEDEFDAMSVEEKISIQVDAFGEEE